MAGRKVVYGGGASAVGGSNTSSFLLQNQKVRDPWLAFKMLIGEKRSERSFFHSFDQEENVDKELDEYFHQDEKKRRLTPDQIQFLERNFEVENKLEPERKVQLAMALGLQPRQVAIWFQNRRARWKTKHLEKDYEVLQASYNSLKADYDGLLMEKEKLKAEVLHLTEKLLLKHEEKGNLESLDTKKQSPAPLQEPITDSEVAKVAIVSRKQEDLSSAKSDVLDSDSPHYIDGGHSSLLEPVDSSYVFEPDQSDLSHDEEDNFKNLLPTPAYMFSKIEGADYPDPPANSCSFGFLVEDHNFGLWSY